jgi:hypothetical protein
MAAATPSRFPSLLEMPSTFFVRKFKTSEANILADMKMSCF